MKPLLCFQWKCSLCLLILISAIAAHADDASKRAKAEQLFVIMHMDRTYAQLMTALTDQTDTMLKQVVPEADMTDGQRLQLAAFKVKVDALITSQMCWEALRPDYVKLYADTYSEADLDGIIAFYRSPVGEKMLEKTPELLKASSNIAMSHMGLVEPKLHQMMEDFEQQIKSSGGKIP